jgi:3',5'-cyclic AMP phosphodiesterase CpdA
MLARGIVIALVQLALASHDGKLRVVVAGDVGYGTERIAAGIAKIGPVDAIIIPGDNVYPCGVQSKDDPRWRVLTPLTRFNIPLFPVLGNHDYCGNAEAEINAAVPNWDFPAKSYSIRSDVAEFVMIDTQPYINGGEPPAIAFASDDRWRIVVGHHPIISSGYHGYFPRREVRRMRRLLPLLQRAHADLYISGHDHHQELVDGKPKFLISGAGSEPVPPIILRSATLFPSNAPFREPYGFTLLEITRDELAITFYDEHAKKRGGPILMKR